MTAPVTMLPLTPDDYERYSRHLILPEVGVEGQRRLKSAKVLCIGSGGLGSPLLLYLAAVGIGRIGIVDFDVVDRSNLQRQVIHGTSWVGKPKTQSAKERILELNPYCQVDIYETRLQASNALDIFAPYDVIVDGTDNFPTRYLVNDACVLLNKPNVYGSIFRFEGQATVFNYKGGWKRPAGWEDLSQAQQKALRDRDQDWVYDSEAIAPNYRDLYPEPPPPGMVPSCAEGGVLGILPGVIGLIQATETIKIILGKGRTLSGRLLLYNALDMTFKELKLRPNPVRPVIDKLIDYEQFCGIPQANPMTETQVPEITVQELKQIMDHRLDEYLIVDVRNPNEWEITRLPHTVLIPLPEIENGQGVSKIQAMLNGRKVAVHCRTGGRSAKAVGILQKAGIDAVNVKGGVHAWSDAIDPTVPKY
jgi:molybdopterin/thiamine biosynthesis adenylyltransferase/rhodanese-related sulfurtransferase